MAVIGEKAFKIEINSIEDFARFLKVIRNEEMEAKQLTELASRLKDSQINLQNALDKEK